MTLEGLQVSDTAIDHEEPVRVSVVLEAVADGVTVTGEVSARWRGPCHLCLDEVTGPLVAHVQELYSDQPTDEEVYQLDRENIDLTPMVSDALLLELPLLARCPYGGVGRCERAPDLVEPDDSEDVAPVEAPRDPRWSALDDVEFD